MAELLPTAEVHVWLLRRPQQFSPAWLARITTEEQQRAQAMQSERRRCEWLAGRLLLRQCLGHYTGADVLSLAFGKTAAGKPQLALAGAPAFNLSHGPQWIGCAVAQAITLGLDIDSETRRNSTDEIAERYFHPHEQAVIRQAADGAGRKQAFFRSWTLKEAYIKALGETINSVRLHELGFAADARPLFGAGQGWQFAHWRFDRHQHLALACQWRECDTDEQSDPVCRFWEWNPDTQLRRELTGEWPCQQGIYADRTTEKPF